MACGGRWRYIDSMRHREEEDFTVSSRDDFDLYASYALGPGMLDGLTLNAGVENVTNEDPPIFPSSIAANTEPSQYDLLGRRYYMSLSYRF